MSLNHWLDTFITTRGGNKMKIEVEYIDSWDLVPVRGEHYHSIYDRKHVGECDDCNQLLYDAMYEWAMEGLD